MPKAGSRARDRFQKITEQAHRATKLTAQILANGREAVDLFKLNIDRINLVLLDVVMPEMDGPQAYEHIRALRPDVPVVFSSGYTPEAVPFIAAVGKSSQVLQKPYTMKGLSQTIRATLDSRAVRESSESPSPQPIPVKNK